MKNNSVQQTDASAKTVNMQKVTAPRLSDDAFYLLALASQLKKLLRPVSLEDFLATGEPVILCKKAS